MSNTTEQKMTTIELFRRAKYIISNARHRDYRGDFVNSKHQILNEILELAELADGHQGINPIDEYKATLREQIEKQRDYHAGHLTNDLERVYVNACNDILALLTTEKDI